MNTQFKNLTQLLDFFKDEEVCKAYYEKARVERFDLALEKVSKARLTYKELIGK